MKFQIAKLVLIVVTVTSVCLTTFSSVTAQKAPKSSTPWLTHIVMMNTRTGWGTTPTRVVRTMDGGRTWHTELTVPRQPSSSNLPGFAFASIGSNMAWAVKSSSQGLQTYRTTNAGVTWIHSRQSFAGEKSVSVLGQLVFADPQHGWLVLHDGAAAGSAPHEILRTSNGGRRWTRVEFAFLNGHKSRNSLPTCDGAAGYLSFVNAMTGWASGFCGAGAQLEELFQTNNGGHTWHQEAVPTSESKLTFFNPGQVTVAGPHRILLLPVSLASPPVFILYRSIDGGLSWKPSTPIRGGSPYADAGPYFSFGPLNNLISWVMIGHALDRTTDGGIRWYVMNKNSRLATPAELDFVDKHDGFALDSTFRSAHIYATTDSGRHWSKIAVSRS